MRNLSNGPSARTGVNRERHEIAHFGLATHVATWTAAPGHLTPAPGAKVSVLTTLQERMLRLLPLRGGAI
jgi:hypothetical protein